MVYADKGEVDKIRSSGLFDAQWYVARYPDVKVLKMDPVEHYLIYGAALGRNPSPSFDAAKYAAAHEEILDQGVNPLLHHLRERRRGADEEGMGAGGVRPGDGSAWRNSYPRVAVVIPVYNAAAETAECIRTVLAHTHPSVRLIVIDDASPDPEIAVVLAKLGGDANVMVVRNHENLGYTATVNRGITIAGDADVVFLNSDARVGPQWLRNLRLAAYSGDKVATATPFSDNAGAFSAPHANQRNPCPESMSDEEYVRCVSRFSERIYPRIPTGSGYCMYVRRACIEEIGPFDVDSFPRGYGEENDFCVRATRAGWTHVIDDATLVYHHRSASFGTEREQLVRSARAIIDQRYPEYKRSIAAFLGDSMVRRARQRVGEAANRFIAPIRPRALFVISTTTGGTPQTNEDLMQALQERYETYLLICDSRRIQLRRVTEDEQVTLKVHDLNQRIMPFPHISDEYDSYVAKLLVDESIELVHIRHIAWHSLNLPEVCSHLQVPVVFSFHDFYSICPTIKLLDENLTYCGGVCTSTAGECKPELWHPADFPRLKHQSVYSWQDRMRKMFSHCDAFITTSDSALRQMLTNYPELKYRPFRVIPHGRNLVFDRVVSDHESFSQPTRILVPGNIGIPKGALLIEQLMLIDAERRLEFHVLGRTNIVARDGLVLHGAYDRGSFNRLVKEIGPSVGMILSIWPETHCHTLTELWACGLPVFALDFGAVGERIRRHGGGWLLPHGVAEGVYDRLSAIFDDQCDYGEKVRSVWRWQEGPGRVEDTYWMASNYDVAYQDLLDRRRHRRVGQTLSPGGDVG